jgi:exopolysaccharide biosynthesis protein
MLVAALALALQAQTPPLLELRVRDAWQPWRAGAPGSAAAKEGALAAALVWRDSAAGLRSGDFEVRTPGGLRNSIALIELDPGRFRFALGLSAPDARRSAADWIAEDTALVLAANTGLFRANGTTQGLAMLDGVRHSALAGWLDAVVVLERGGLRFTDIEGARALPTGASAFQTLPWLVREGRVVFGWTYGLRLSRTHRDRRIVLCRGDDGLVRLLLSNFEVFGATAGRVPIGLTIPEQAALAAGAGCRDAVALDGGISSQIVFRAGGRVVKWPGWRRVPLMLLVHRR